jgi:hypothetical protein
MVARVLVTAALALAAGCGGDAGVNADAGAADADTDLDFIPCTNDPRVQQYVPGMEQVGSNARFKVKLVASEPAPPAKPLDVWTIDVTDANGALASGLGILVAPYMPDHRHSPPVAPIVSALGEPGRYSIAQINLFMAGVWQVKMTLTPPGAASDAVTFWFCVDR